MKVKPKCRFHIPLQVGYRSFERAFQARPQTRVDFFYDIHKYFFEELNNALHSADIPIAEAEFGGRKQICLTKLIEVVPIKSQYHPSIEILRSMATRGFGAESLRSVNENRNGGLKLPSLLPFLKTVDFSIGNFAFPVPSDDYEIVVSADEGIRFHGYSYHISKRTGKCYFALIGVYFTRAFLTGIIDRYFKKYDGDYLDLDEVYLSDFPILFISRKSGELITCRCFQQLMKGDDFRRVSNEEQLLKGQIENLMFQDGICHMCRRSTPKLKYWGQSVFQRKYQPYFELLRRKMYGDRYPNWTTILPQREKENEIENAVREIFGYPEVGTLGISETIVFNLVKDIFYPLEVVHHYRGKELEGLELDIWIPAKKLGIEYQGEQHYDEFKHWGGTEGLIRRKQNDARKKILCHKLDYDLIRLRNRDVYTTEDLLPLLETHLN